MPDKQIIVTGAKGIGAAIAVELFDEAQRGLSFQVWRRPRASVWFVT